MLEETKASDLQTIERLQEIDSELDRLADQEATLPEKEQRELLAAEKQELEEVVEERLGRLRAEELQQKKLEGEVELISTKIEKEQKKLYSGTIANPKELASIQQEVKSLRGHLDAEETALLEQLEVVEKLRSEEGEKAETLSAIANELAETERTLEEKVGAIEGGRRRLQQEREQVAGQVPESMMHLYLGLRKKYRKAVVPLKDGFCQGCRVELPAEDVDRMIGSDRLWRCPNCGRILLTHPQVGP